MKTIPFSEARAHLKEIIDQVQAGESVQISRNGKVVAELRPPHSPKTWNWDHLKNPPFTQEGMSEFLLQERKNDPR